MIHKTLGAFFADLQPTKDRPIPAEINFANGVFYEDRYRIKKQYQQLAADFYNGQSSSAVTLDQHSLLLDGKVFLRCYRPASTEF